MSIKLMMEIERAHSRLDKVEEFYRAPPHLELLAKIEKIEGEIKAMKARMGKREPAEI